MIEENYFHSEEERVISGPVLQSIICLTGQPFRQNVSSTVLDNKIIMVTRKFVKLTQS